jgi:hypothetical protein
LTGTATCAAVHISLRFFIATFCEEEITDILERILRTKRDVEHDIGRRCCFGIASWTRTDQEDLANQLRLKKRNNLSDEHSMENPRTSIEE